MLVKAAYICIFLVGIFCLSAPYEYLGGPIYGPLWVLNPSSYGTGTAWLKIIGSVCLVFAVERCSTIQPPFTNAFAQYLGLVSPAMTLP